MNDELGEHLREHNVRPLVPGVTCPACKKCGGDGWCWGRELDNADGNTQDDTMTQYTCDWCGGDGKEHDPFDC